MQYSAFHFADFALLCGLLLIPLLAAGYALFYKPVSSNSRLAQFADKHLLPHLLKGTSSSARSFWRTILLWSLIWACGVIALAGPRWDYTDFDTYKSGQDMVVLLDLSKSMDVTDVKPSRMVQAREKVNDLLKMAYGINIGLVAYAADAHIISPITEDKKAILDFLPYIDTSLPYVQGNNLKPALTVASHMLASQPGDNKSVVIISDGDFSDKNILENIDKNIAVYAIGIGNDQRGLGQLQNLSSNGGFYRAADYTNGDIKAIVKQIRAKETSGKVTGHKTRYWQEHFYIPVGVMMLLMLPWFRRGYIFPLILFFIVTMPTGNASAAEWQDLFLNESQQAERNYNKSDYKTAATQFTDVYQRGVAEYKAGDFLRAEQSFANSGAGYNLGNAEVMEGKYQDAINSYQTVLKQQPNNANAQHNLEIAKKLLELQKQNKQQQQQKDQNQSQQQKQSADNKQDSGGQGKQDQKDQNSNGSGKNQQQNAQQQPFSSKGRQSPQYQTQGQQTAQRQNSAGQKPSTGVDEQKEAGQQPGAPKNPGEKSEQKTGEQNTAANSADIRPRTQKDVEADQWLNRIDNDPQTFLRNQFYVESVKNGTAKGE